jgi:LysM repeat protein
MNNSSPLIPQGSMLEQKNKSRARVRLAVFIVLSIHVVGLMTLLVQGCRRTGESDQAISDTNAAAPPMMETTNPPSVGTNPPVAVAPAPVVDANLPPVAPASQEYAVAKGDSFFSIAKKFGVTMKAIQDANPSVQPTKLRIGQKLQIPAGAGAPSTKAAIGEPAGVASGAAGEQSYTVKSGDTLTKIAAEFGATVKAIRSDNNLTTDKIKVGQKLKIPAKASAPATVPATPSAPTPVPAASSPTA